jgi:hypothetical protein
MSLRKSLQLASLIWLAAVVCGGIKAGENQESSFKLSCCWENPTDGAELSIVFPGNALVACAPGGTVMVTATSGNRKARITAVETDNILTYRGGGEEVRLLAPEQVGPHFVRLGLDEGGRVGALTLCVYVPHKAELSRRGYLSLDGFVFGLYRDPAKSGVAKVKANADTYVPPKWFIGISAETEKLLVSPTVTLGELVVAGEDDGKRHSDYAPVCYPLLLALENFRDALARQKVKSGALKIISAFRSPRYNRKIGSGAFSRHAYADAFDYIIDADGDGKMDDLTGDGKVDRLDGLWLVALIEDLQADKYLPVGGIGVYTFATGDHTVTMHLDLRGHRARWAFHHDARGRKQEFSWKSRRFAELDEREWREKKTSWRAPEENLPVTDGD